MTHEHFIQAVAEHTRSRRHLGMMSMTLMRKTTVFALAADELLTAIATQATEAASHGRTIDAAALADLITDTRQNFDRAFNGDAI